MQVADEGLKLDPNNWDLYDLKSNACLFQSNFPCAIDALGPGLSRSTRPAPTRIFYRKIAVAAAQQPDTVRLLEVVRSAASRSTRTTLELLGYAEQALPPHRQDGLDAWR